MGTAAHVATTSPATPRSDPGVAAGDLIAGKYRVAEVLGEGGMGIVLAATHEGLGQRVAIKILQTHDAETDARFDLEARALARLRSEHVVRTFDIGTLGDGRRYMVMERLDGRDLGTLIEMGIVPVETAVDYVLQACEGIADAHAQGIVHRDLKPRNLFLTKTVDGRPLIKVLDFGVSKLESASGDFRLTQTAEVLGSPSYMSPEQLISTRDVDARTDIWSIGVILYELLTGDLPFLARTITELAIMIDRDREIAVHERRREVPKDLSNVVARCLAKKPADRFASVIELVDALVPFASRGSVALRVRGVAEESGRLSLVAPAPVSPEHRPLSRSATERSVVAVTSPLLPPAPASRSRTVVVGLAAACAAIVFLGVAWRAQTPRGPSEAQTDVPTQRPTETVVGGGAVPATAAPVASAAAQVPAPPATAPVASASPIAAPPAASAPAPIVKTPAKAAPIPKTPPTPSASLYGRK